MEQLARVAEVKRDTETREEKGIAKVVNTRFLASSASCD